MEKLQNGERDILRDRREKFIEERDTYELVEEALEDEPEISDADFYGKEEVKKRW